MESEAFLKAKPKLLVVQKKYQIDNYTLFNSRYRLHATARGETAISNVTSYEFDVLIIDAELYDMPGLKLLKDIARILVRKPVIIFAAYSENKDDRLEAMRLGACDYIVSPITEEHQKNMWDHVLRLKREDAVTEEAERLSRLQIITPKKSRGVPPPRPWKPEDCNPIWPNYSTAATTPLSDSANKLVIVLNKRAKKEAIVSATRVSELLVEAVNGGVQASFVNEKRIELEIRALAATITRFMKHTDQWLAASHAFNTALKEMGDIENWMKTMEFDCKSIVAAMHNIHQQ